MLQPAISVKAPSWVYESYGFIANCRSDGDHPRTELDLAPGVLNFDWLWPEQQAPFRCDSDMWNSPTQSRQMRTTMVHGVQ